MQDQSLNGPLHDCGLCIIEVLSPIRVGNVLPGEGDELGTRAQEGGDVAQRPPVEVDVEVADICKHREEATDWRRTAVRLLQQRVSYESRQCQPGVQRAAEYEVSEQGFAGEVVLRLADAYRQQACRRARWSATGNARVECISAVRTSAGSGGGGRDSPPETLPAISALSSPIATAARGRAHCKPAFPHSKGEGETRGSREANVAQGGGGGLDNHTGRFVDACLAEVHGYGGRSGGLVGGEVAAASAEWPKRGTGFKIAVEGKESALTLGGGLFCIHPGNTPIAPLLAPLLRRLRLDDELQQPR
ncbi:hypothetical protein BDK51DRAFT_44899 [Blyttiomyces helicus]|uniref:Uncharacterized protein n=1 Tax=Blyttiomyces helicus TaxID=388810 RepID=A0A4P9VYS3_9FUNG|nr:hypothetical protein BDK51DRAFT_44899 [Blyttiomyces helicus]|eukprot:RKO83468.1 hypothetical protein BDK51DRAFT_44899 [Blyttiomyces helicus]